MEGLLTVTQAAEYLDISRARVYKMIKDEVMIPVRVGGKPFFTEQQLDARIQKVGKPKERVNCSRLKRGSL